MVNILYICVIFEYSGSTYGIFKQHVSKKIVWEGEIEEDIDKITDEEIFFINQLDSAFITEAHEAIKENKEVFVTSSLAIVVGIFVIVSLLIWIIIMIW